MNAITAVYLILLLAGIAWLVYRVRIYIRAERERESRWVEMASDKSLTAQMESMKRTPDGRSENSGAKSRATAPTAKLKTGEQPSRQVRKSRADRPTTGSRPAREDEKR